MLLAEHGNLRRLGCSAGGCMEYVRLAPGLPPSSRLGFGCGSVMGRIGRAASLRAIAAALDAGITHFHVARLYGYREAEALLRQAGPGPPCRALLPRQVRPSAA